MNNLLLTPFRNFESIIQERLTKKSLEFDEFVKTNEFDALLSIYWADFIEIIEQNNLEFIQEDLIKELKIDFEKAEPTEAIAVDYRLENWLDQAERTRKQLRFNSYKKNLSLSGKGSIVNQLEGDTFEILDKCHDPSILDREWDRRGLVYGHVQSGKTANYIGLINRAFDSGYKIVIVLTGVTEDLRRQTQKRIDQDVLELNNRLNKSKLTEKIYSITNIENDLSKSRNTDLAVNHTVREHSIWVIKKNKTVLENLILWLDKQRKDQGLNKIKETPFLIIDDEADNASIQSLSKKDYEEWDQALGIDNIDDDLSEEQEEILKNAQSKVIKAINRNIRVALSLMSNKTFVAYTATPYSVINQAIEDIEREVVIKGQKFIIEKDSDLFPEHFIIPIKPGKTYFGIDRIFNSRDDLNIPATINITNRYSSEIISNIFPTTRGSEYIFDEIPNSLKDSIIFFLISIVIKKHRGIRGYNSMLIHTSHLTDRADYVADKVSQFVKSIYNELGISDSKLMEKFHEIFNEIKEKSNNPLFNEYFRLKNDFPENITAQDISNIFNDKKQKLEVVSYHSSKSSNLRHSNHTLNYDEKDSFSNEKIFKNYIVIGGNRLSRGLTLEGLVTSYFIRSSTRQDSLYQMSRWLGYRTGYEDLVKIFMPEDQILWYKGIFNLEKKLRHDFEENNDPDAPILPRNAIIKMANEIDENDFFTPEQRRKYPSICDPAKLRKTSQEYLKFSGPITTNRIDPSNQKEQEDNFISVTTFFENLLVKFNKNLFNTDRMKNLIESFSNISFEDIPTYEVVKFLQKFNFHNSKLSEWQSFIHYIDENSDHINKWSISLVNKKKNKEVPNLEWDLSRFYIGEDKIPKLKKLTRSPNKLSNGDWAFNSFIDSDAKDTSFDVKTNKNKDLFQNAPERTVKKLREEQKKPLLLIYPVFYSNEETSFIFPLLYVYYPDIKFDGKKVKYFIRNKYIRS